jgi:transposase
VFTNMELWSQIRQRVRSGALSLRQACREYHLNFRTVQKIVRHAEPAPYQQSQPRPRPVLGPFLSIIEQILLEDQHAPPKQRHTARRIYDRLRDEHGYRGCPSIVRAAVRSLKQAQAEVFVPLFHPPGEAQCDYGHATVEIAEQAVQAAFFVLTLPHCGARFAAAYPRECTESFHAGHVAAFTFFGGVPSRISYDNSKIAVVKLTGPHERELTAAFCRLQSHFLFAAHFCRARQAQEKGHVENGVGYVRRNFLVPVPRAQSWEELNARLAQDCFRDRQRTPAGRSAPIEGLLPADQAAFGPLPADPFEPRRVEVVAINSLSLGRFDRNDYSVPCRYAYQTLTATGTPDVVRFTHRGVVVAQHRRCWGRRQTFFDPLHYLALLERKPGALDHALPLAGWSLPDCFAALRQRLEQANPAGGTRAYIRVLRLLEAYDLERLTAAVERALTLGIVDADAVRLVLERQTEQPAERFDLTGRPTLQAVRVPKPDLTAYEHLRTKEVDHA